VNPLAGEEDEASRNGCRSQSPGSASPAKTRRRFGANSGAVGYPRRFAPRRPVMQGVRRHEGCSDRMFFSKLLGVPHITE
jgi:hypothetical protein